MLVVHRRFLATFTRAVGAALRGARANNARTACNSAGPLPHFPFVCQNANERPCGTCGPQPEPLLRRQGSDEQNRSNDRYTYALSDELRNYLVAFAEWDFTFPCDADGTPRRRMIIGTAEAAIRYANCPLPMPIAGGTDAPPV